MVSLVDYLNESLRQHISVELDWCIYEKHGSYDGIDFHSMTIYNKIKDFLNNHHNNESYRFSFSSEKEFTTKNVFFENIIILIKNSKNTIQCGYNSLCGLTYGEGNDKNKLMCIELNVIMPFNKMHDDYMEDELLKQISHELTHAYEDYQLVKNGKGGLTKLFDEEYKNASINPNENLCSLYKYFFTEPEKNAYIAELREYMLIKARKVNMFDQNASKNILTEVKDSTIYKKYINIASQINSLTIDSDELKDIMKLKAFKGMTPNKVVKKLKDDALRLKNKLEKTIAKTVCDCIEIETPKRVV